MTKKLAFVFPGQGSQALGMQVELIQQHTDLMHYFDEATEILGFDLWDLIQKGPLETLNMTEKTQPALLVTSYLTWKIWEKNNGPTPDVFAGHSLGEYTALLCAQTLSFHDAVYLVSKRALFMQEAVPENMGAMAAIVGLDHGRVEEICHEVSGEHIVSPANFNSMGQVVIAGDRIAVERAIHLANDVGAKLAKILQVSVPSHCPLMKPAAEKLAQALNHIDFQKPNIAMINNVDACVYSDPALIKNALIRQLYSPVKWVDTVMKMQDLGIKTVVECGPGKILAGLMKRIDKDFEIFSLNDQESLMKAIHSI